MIVLCKMVYNLTKNVCDMLYCFLLIETLMLFSFFFFFNYYYYFLFAFIRYDFRAGFWGVMGQPCLGIISVRSNHSWLMHLFVR